MSEHDIDPALSELYRRVSGGEPPNTLDETILASARTRAADHARRRRHRHFITLSTAAVLVLGLSLTLRLNEYDQPPGVVMERGEAPLLMAPPMKRRQAAPAEPESLSDTVEEGATSGEGLSLEVGVESVPMRDEAPTQGHSVMEREVMTPPDTGFDAMEPRPAATILSDPPHETYFAPGKMLKSAPERRVVPSSPRAADDGEGTERRKDLGADRGDVDELKNEAVEGAEAWLAQIENLLAQGRRDEAREILRRFVERYPDYRLPEHLQRMVNE